MSEHVPVNDEHPLFSNDIHPDIVKAEERRLELLFRNAELEGRIEMLEEEHTKLRQALLSVVAAWEGDTDEDGEDLMEEAIYQEAIPALDATSRSLSLP